MIFIFILFHLCISVLLERKGVFVRNLSFRFSTVSFPHCILWWKQSFGRNLPFVSWCRTVIKDVLPGGLAEESGCLYANDIILAINNHPVGCANDSEILKLLQQPGDVTILVAKSLNVS